MSNILPVNISTISRREDGGWCGVYSNTRCILLCSSLISSLITRLTYVLF